MGRDLAMSGKKDVSVSSPVRQDVETNHKFPVKVPVFHKI